MELLRLGLAGLSAAENALVATLFRLHGVDRSFIWTLAVEQPFDALLVDVQCPETEIQHLKGTHTRLMRLERHGVQSDGVMSRPIRSDLLLNWLNSIEIDLLHNPGGASASTTPPSQIEVISVLPQLKHLTPARAATVAPAKPPLPPGWASRGDGTEYKLVRWPPQSMLNKDVARVRVATMMSRRAMSLQEASTLSRIPPERCEEFLIEWTRHGLVSMSDRPVANGMTAPPNPTSDAARLTSRAGFGASLIHSIRKRFGIL